MKAKDEDYEKKKFFVNLTVASQSSKLSLIKVLNIYSNFNFFKPVNGRVDLSNCSLWTIDGLQSQQKIESMYLRSNFIKNFPPYLPFFNLKVLDISNNKFKSFAFIEQMPQLRVCLLNYSEIELFSNYLRITTKLLVFKTYLTTHLWNIWV
jgi:Leucine-rich repeat (LRR) protein